MPTSWAIIQAPVHFHYRYHMCKSVLQILWLLANITNGRKSEYVSHSICQCQTAALDELFGNPHDVSFSFNRLTMYLKESKISGNITMIAVSKKVCFLSQHKCQCRI